MSYFGFNFMSLSLFVYVKFTLRVGGKENYFVGTGVIFMYYFGIL